MTLALQLPSRISRQQPRHEEHGSEEEPEF